VDRWFELWDAEGAALIGSFDTETAALNVVRRSLDAFGESSVLSLVLTEEDGGDADPRVIASGQDLAALARRTEASLMG
jgi:hypothetical protein